MASHPSSEARPLTHPLRAAQEARDVDGVVRLLAPSVVFRSPVTRFPIEGLAAVTRLVQVVVPAFETYRCVRELSDGDVHVLEFEARIGGRDVHGADVLHHDVDGLIDEFTVLARPLSGIAAFASVAGPALAARHGALRARVTRALVAPLPGFLAFTDRVGTRLADPNG